MHSRSVAVLLLTCLAQLPSVLADDGPMKERATIPAHEAKIRALAYSPDGTLLASAGDDHKCRVWRVADGTLESLGEPLTGQSSVVFSSDGETLYAGLGGGGKKLFSYSVADRSVVREIDAGHSVLSIALSPQGRRVVTGAHQDDHLKVWDATNGREIKSLQSSSVAGREVRRTTSRPMGFVSYSPDGKYLVGCAAPSFYAAVPTIWDADTFAVKARFIAHHNRCYAITFSPDGRTIAIGTQDGSIKLWKVEAAIEAWRKRGGSAVDDRTLNKLIAQLDDDDFETREAAERQLKQLGPSIEEKLAQARASTDAPEVLTRLKRILAGLKGNAAEPLKDLAPRILEEEHAAGIRSLAYSPDGRYLAAGAWEYRTKNGRLTVWDTRAADEPIVHLDTLGVEAVTFSPDGKTLAAGMHNGEVKLWDILTADK